MSYKLRYLQLAKEKTMEKSLYDRHIDGAKKHHLQLLLRHKSKYCSALLLPQCFKKGW